MPAGTCWRAVLEFSVSYPGNEELHGWDGELLPEDD